MQVTHSVEIVAINARKTDTQMPRERPASARKSRTPVLLQVL